ncbi:MAG: hypothetical protein CMO66_02540 [Verrucomicrobiales bacterium]|nr:hypothetical protein [Verrucomicrobiales bacterium]
MSNSVAPLLAARGLCKTYQMGQQSLAVLREVDFDLERGRFVALCGASGSGKTTLLHLLAGLDQPTEGTIQFSGRNIAQMDEIEAAEFRNKHIGLVFQAYHLISELDALENVTLPARLQRMPSGEAEQRARELLEAVGLKDRLHHRPTELSGGEQQRVAIARALVNNPKLVLADEPTGNLDTGTEKEIIDLLRDLQAERNLTLLVATHDEHVAESAGVVVHLSDGHMVHVTERTARTEQEPERLSSPGKVVVNIARHAEYSRGQLLFRTLLGLLFIAVPHVICFAILGFGCLLATVVVWFAILFTKSHPRILYRFQRGVLQWSIRFNAAMMNLVDGYPALGLGNKGDAVEVCLERPESFNRWLCVARLFAGVYVGVPHGICLFARYVAAIFILIAAFFIVMFTGKYPPNMHHFMVGTLRWQARVQAYLSLMTDRYPPFSGRE